MVPRGFKSLSLQFQAFTLRGKPQRFSAVSASDRPMKELHAKPTLRYTVSVAGTVATARVPDWKTDLPAERRRS